MEVKEILTPKNMLIALGTIVIVMSLYGMTHGDEWAEFGWGADNVQPHDEAYEEMWADCDFCNNQGEIEEEVDEDADGQRNPN